MSELDLGGLIRGSLDQKKFQDEHWQGTFQQYLELLEQNPLIARTSHQRLYDMILSYGQDEVEIDKEKVPSYRFFKDPIEDGRDVGANSASRPRERPGTHRSGRRLWPSSISK